MTADPTCPRQKGHLMTAAQAQPVDIFLDAIRLVQATMHGDTDAYNAVVQTTEATPSEVVFAMASILAAAASQHDDPDAAIRDLRNAFVNVSTA